MDDRSQPSTTQKTTTRGALRITREAVKVMVVKTGVKAGTGGINPHTGTGGH